MKVHLKSGAVIETVGDYPVLQTNGLYRFDQLLKDLGTAWVTATTVTSDPLVPADNIDYIEK